MFGRIGETVPERNEELEMGRNGKPAMGRNGAFFPDSPLLRFSSANGSKVNLDGDP
jgi:hypothetical protein